MEVIYKGEDATCQYCDLPITKGMKVTFGIHTACWEEHERDVNFLSS